MARDQRLLTGAGEGAEVGDGSGPLLLDDEDTWPEELVLLLRGGLATLAAYEQVRAAIDDAAENDIMLKIRRPPNDYQQARDDILSECEAIAAATDVVAWHCTRLTEAEAEDVRLNGLRPLSAQLAGDRLARAGEGGHLPPDVIDALRASNQATADNRAGRVYLILSASLLRDEEGVYRLLGYWGGEALYGLHEDDRVVAAALRSTGLPSLVEVAVPAAAVDSYCSPGERLMRVFLARQGIDTGEETRFQGVVRSGVPAERVRRVIWRPELEFEALTGCAGWTGKHRI